MNQEIKDGLVAQGMYKAVGNMYREAKRMSDNGELELGEALTVCAFLNHMLDLFTLKKEVEE